jgi:hypothetical protein
MKPFVAELNEPPVEDGGRDKDSPRADTFMNRALIPEIFRIMVGFPKEDLVRSPKISTPNEGNPV